MSNVENRTRVTEKTTLTLGDRLRLARVGSNVTVQELARRLDIKPVSVYEKENGNNAVYEGFIYRAEEALGITRGTIGQDVCDINGREKVFEIRVQRKPRSQITATRVAEVIAERIGNGVYTDRIPTNVNLAEEFGTHRSTIDTATRKLRKDGLIVSNKRAGKTSVKPQ